MTRLPARLRRLAVALTAMLAALFVVQAAPAQAAIVPSFVINSALSTAPILVCSDPAPVSSCTTVYPNYYSSSTDSFYPSNVGVGGGYCILYRVERFGVAQPVTGWLGLCAPVGQVRWLDVDFLNAFYGPNITVTVIIDYHG